MTSFDVFLQQLIVGLSNGMIIALIALGYTMVYGIIELINFAHGDLFMLGSFCALTILGLIGAETIVPGSGQAYLTLGLILILVSTFCGGLNWLINRWAYRPLRNAPKLAPLVSAIGVSFILMNIGLFWGGLPMDVFNLGRSAASPKDFPMILGNQNFFGESNFQFGERELLVFVITIPLIVILTLMVKFTSLGKSMRAVAQNPVAAELMGIDTDRVIGWTFIIGGALAGVASVIYALYNNTIYFQMGFRTGIDAFTAAVLGGIGNLPGAMLGGLLIGLVRAMSDQYIETQWTNVVVFSILILFLTFRPSGILGARLREKV